MGLHSSNLDLIHSWTQKTCAHIVRPRMLELGDQVIVDVGTTGHTTGKQFFQSLGYEHVSVDINGQHGAERLDLTRPRNFLHWRDHYDVITNAGTTEHIEPFEHQFTCFKIIHDCAKTGALMIHIVPDAQCMIDQGQWRGHCAYYYSKAFFNMLAHSNDYAILYLDLEDQLVRAVLQKRNSSDFMVDKDLFFSKIHNTLSRQ